MQIKNSINTKNKKNLLVQNEINSEKVDINVLLNRVKIEKKDAVKKNLVITVGALGTLALTGLITLF